MSPSLSQRIECDEPRIATEAGREVRNALIRVVAHDSTSSRNLEDVSTSARTAGILVRFSGIGPRVVGAVAGAMSERSVRPCRLDGGCSGPCRTDGQEVRRQHRMAMSKSQGIERYN